MKERFSSNRSLFTSVFSVLQMDVFVYVLAILTGVIVARTLGPNLLGVWVLLSLVSSYAEAFGRIKTDIASVYILGSEKKAKPEEVLFSITFFALITSLLITLVLFWQLELIESILFKNTDLNYKKELICIIFFIPFEFLLHNFSYFYIALENVVFYNRIKLIQAIINLGAIVLLIFAFDFTLWALVLARILSVSITLLYSWLSLDSKNWVGLRSRWNSYVNLQILRYAFNFYVIGIIGHFNELTVKTIAAIFLNTSQLAFYSQGEAASKLLKKIPDSLGVILYPRISRTEAEENAVEISCTSFRLDINHVKFWGNYSRFDS